MNNHLSFKRDFAYKFIKTTSFIDNHETPKIILPLWRFNRLSVLRGYMFMTMFFTPFNLTTTKKITFKIKKNSKRTESFFIFVLNPEKFTNLLFLDIIKNDVIVSEIASGKRIQFIANIWFVEIIFLANNTPLLLYEIFGYIKKLMLEQNIEKHEEHEKHF